MKVLYRIPTNSSSAPTYVHGNKLQLACHIHSSANECVAVMSCASSN